MTSRSGANHIGTLSDTDIESLCSHGKLIIQNYNPSNIQQACYELRASNIYYDLATDTKYDLKDGEYIIIKPKQLAVIITLEALELPADILGRILTKGKLFSVGLLPVNTYADPGFYGNLGMVFCNLSNNFLKIYPKDSVAKIEFTRLAKPVSKPYRGQHGYQTKIWPIPKEMILTADEMQKDARVKSAEEEIILSHGKDVGNVINRVFRFERYLILAATTYFLFSLILVYAIQQTNWLAPTISIVLGVIANVFTSFLVYITTNIRRK